MLLIRHLFWLFLIALYPVFIALVKGIDHGEITKGVEGKDGNPGNPCLDSYVDIVIYYLGTFDENANDSC